MISISLTDEDGTYANAGGLAVNVIGNAPAVSSFRWETPYGFDPTNVPTVTYALAFNKPVTGVDASDFTIVLTGQSVTDPTIQRTLNETIRVRNASLTGTCPA